MWGFQVYGTKGSRKQVWTLLETGEYVEHYGKSEAGPYYVRGKNHRRLGVRETLEDGMKVLTDRVKERVASK